jgi:hypothetical protein
VNLENLFILLIPVLVSVYTVSYGVWTWKNKNRLGAVMIFVLALTVTALPAYKLLFME